MLSATQKSIAATSSHRRWVAGLLSLAIPGLGQVLEGHISRGLILFLLPMIALFAFCHSGGLVAFSGMLIFLLVELLLWAVAVADAMRQTPATPVPGRAKRIAWAMVFASAWAALLLPPVNPVLAGNMRIFEVSGDAMTPTLQPGDWVVVSLDSWTNQPLRRGEIVAYRHHDAVLARRILGLPGDTITFQDGRVRRNGEWLNESYADLTPVAGVDPEELLPVQVKEGELYVLGDTRNRSIDSHSASYGAVHPADVIGRADYILWSHPLNRIGQALR